MIKRLAFLLLTLLLGCSVQAQPSQQPTFPVQKTDAEWRATLTPEQYQVLRQKGTEARFSSQCTLRKEDGDYFCAGCENLLFSSGDKFDSGTGWPSFNDPVAGSVVTQVDTSHGMERTEVLCADCGGHLGHVFEDGPPPTGLRYCINGVAMKFVPRQE